MRKTLGRPKQFDESVALELAMQHFWRYGYDGSSLSDLLSAMNIKKGSFYLFFKSKEELFSRCLELYTKKQLEHLESIKNELGAKGAMLKLVDLTIEELRTTGSVRGCLLMNSGKECYQKHPNLSNQVSLDYNVMRCYFTKIVEEAQRKSEISSDLSAEQLSGRFMNTLNGLVVSIQAGANQSLIDDIVHSLHEILK